MPRQATGDGYSKNPRTTARLEVRLTLAEKAKIAAAAKAKGQTTSGYIREVVLRDLRFVN